MRHIKRLGLFGALTLTLLGVGVAFAAWTATGSGTGSAKAVTAIAVTVTPGSATPQLYPGGTGNVFYSITNPNDYPVLVTDITRTAAAITSDVGGACDLSTGVTVDDLHGLAVAVAPHATVAYAGTNTAHMSNLSDNSCQGATFTVPVATSSISNA